MADFNDNRENKESFEDFSAVEEEFFDDDFVFTVKDPEDEPAAAFEAASDSSAASGASNTSDVSDTSEAAPDAPEAAADTADVALNSAGAAADTAYAASDAADLAENACPLDGFAEDDIPGADDIFADTVEAGSDSIDDLKDHAEEGGAQGGDRPYGGADSGEEGTLFGSITGKIDVVDGASGDNDRAAMISFYEMEAGAEGLEADAAGDRTAAAGNADKSFLYRFFHAQKGDPLYIPHEIVSYVLIIILAFVAAILINIYIFRLSTVVGGSMNHTFHNGETVFLSRLPYIFGSPKRGDVIIFDHTGEPRTFKKDWSDSIRSNAIVNLFRKSKNIDEDKHEFYIKRVIGIEGDVILIKNNKVYRARAAELGGAYAEYYELSEQYRKKPSDEEIKGKLENARAAFAGIGQDMSQWEELVEPYVNPDETPNYRDWEGRLWFVGSDEVFVMGDNRNHSLDSRNLGTKPVNCILGKVLGNH